MEHRFVCISRTIGADAEEVARLVAERLRFRLIDEEILLEAADKAGVNADDVADVEQRKSFLARVANDMIESGALAAYGPVVPRTGPKRDELRGFIREAIEESIEDGAAVIVAHGASLALTGRDDVLRVLITASLKTRAGRLVAAEQAKEGEAAKLIEESDAARADYLKRFYKVGAELPTSYDLVLNTDRMTAEDAAGIVAEAVKR
jgi:cytidylate kinase